MSATITEWKGRRILILQSDRVSAAGIKYTAKLHMGIAKATLILKELEAIKDFCRMP